MEEDQPLVVMVAGQPRKGKSTALNNLFNLTLDAGPSPDSVTKSYTPRSITREGRLLVVIDTPGIGATDLNPERVMKDIRKNTRGIDFILIYCQSVAPNDCLTELDVTLLCNLQKSLHKKIWTKCVLLLTFSDVLRKESYPNDDAKYIAHIQRYTKNFERRLQSTNVSCTVKSIFDYSDIFSQSPDAKEIIAVPVADNPSKCNIMPKIDLDQKTWIDIAFAEILKKASPIEALKFIDFKYATPLRGSLMESFVGGGENPSGGSNSAIGFEDDRSHSDSRQIRRDATNFVQDAKIFVGCLYHFLRWKIANPERSVKKLLEMSEENLH